MIKDISQPKSRIIYLALALIAVFAMLYLSYSRGRRIADDHVTEMGVDALFYRQNIIVLRDREDGHWPHFVWEVHYEVDLLTGFTVYVRVSLLGHFIDSNVSGDPVLPQTKKSSSTRE